MVLYNLVNSKWKEQRSFKVKQNKNQQNYSTFPPVGKQSQLKDKADSLSITEHVKKSVTRGLKVLVDGHNYIHNLNKDPQIIQLGEDISIFLS